MKRLFKLTVALAVGFMMNHPASAQSAVPNEIRPGTADVTINFNLPENTGVKLDNPTGKVIKTSMFESPAGNLWAEDIEATPLKYDGKSFVGKVPMELANEWVNVILTDKATQFYINVLTLLSQDSPTTIDMNFSMTEPQLTIISSNPEYNKIGWQDWYTLSAIASLQSNNPASEEPMEWLPDTAYKTWNTADKEYWGRMYPDRMKYIVEFSKCGDLYDQSPAWVRNSSKWWFAAKYAMDYVAIAKAKNGLSLPEPPIEYYSFLKDIDFSEGFLSHFPLQSQKVILDKILNISAAGIKPIGETPVKEWQSGVRSALSKAFTPTDLLLDMLAAQSYINQIVEQGKPLSTKQIDNIGQGLDNDLGKIILNKNRK